MCEGIPIFSGNNKAIYGTGTNSHSQAAIDLKINEDEWRKYEYHWWDKKLVADEYDEVAEKILEGVDKKKALKHARTLVKNEFNTDKKIAEWLKDVKNEWFRLIDGKHNRLARMVEPKLILYQEKIAKFKQDDIEKYNPYQAEAIPSLTQIKKHLPKEIRNQINNRVRAQVGDQVWDQVRDQVGAQVRATSYWGVKITLGLPIKNWFFDFLKLGVMIVVVQGKVKVFGKKGRFLGEYDEKDFIN